MEKNKVRIEIDTFETSVPKQYCTVPYGIERSQTYTGLKYYINQDSVYIKVSGKIFATPTDLGSITLNNYHELPNRIYELCGIQIDKNELLNNSELFAVHVKLDIPVEKNTTEYISLLTERFKVSTRKFDVYKYHELIYENGLQIIPKGNSLTDLCGITVVPKTKNNDRFVVYKKGAELKKPENKEYRAGFDMEFLEQLNKVLRFEYQMRKFKDMKEAFDIGGTAPTLFNILNSHENPVFNVFIQLIDATEKEDKYEST